MLEDACLNVLRSCMGLGKDENCLVVTDNVLYKIGKAFADAAKGECAESVLMLMSERSSHGEEPPRMVSDAMANADVIIIPTNKSLSHTQARKKACTNGARVASMPEISEDILGRVSDANFMEMSKDSAKWAAALTGARSVRVTTDAGTDLAFSINGREGQSDDGNYKKKGSFGNIPAGEAFVAPVEGSANGVIVVDGSMADVGIVDVPIKILMSEGFASVITGGASAEKLLEKLSKFDRSARNLAEFAIGTNAAARLTGNVLEDEKIKGTIHFALGDNATIGGNVSSPSHLDGILLRPTVYLDDRLVIDSGSWNI